MDQIVIVIADLYLSDAPAKFSRAGAPDASLPGLGQIARFGERVSLESGWRPWLAHALGRGDLARAEPASVAAAATDEAAEDSTATAWIATPLYVAAGLTTLHFDRRGILRPPRAQLEELALDFQQAFRHSDLKLTPLDSGDFILYQPAIRSVSTTEPARIADVAESLPRGAGAGVLRRLGAEIEMWLHEHPVNRARLAREELPISTLWLWGGGAPVLQGSAGERGRRGSSEFEAFGSDPYLRGLRWLDGHETQPLPQLGTAFGYPARRSSAVVVEAGRMLPANSNWSVLEALAELDRRFIAPAVSALRRQHVERISILANDRRLVLNARDHLKLWRRRRAGIDALQ